MQPSVLGVDIQSPLPGDTDPFSRNDNEGKYKAFKATFHVYTGKDRADLWQILQTEILQHGGKEKKIRRRGTMLSYFIATYAMSFRISINCFYTIKLVKIPQMAKLWGTYCSSETYKKY